MGVEEKVAMMKSISDVMSPERGGNGFEDTRL